MNKMFIFLAAFVWFGLAQDSGIVSDDGTVPESSFVAGKKVPPDKLIAEDFNKFYIGFTSKDNSLEVLTLDINNTENADSSITFHYTLNTKDTREVGVGEIWPGQSRIKFQNNEEGRITVPEDGKIEFESVTQDSVKYWKLKEK